MMLMMMSQVLLTLSIAIRIAPKQLPLSMLLQTIVFVAFNKVMSLIVLM